MPIELIFNDTSIDGTISQAVSKACMTSFISTVVSLKSKGIQKEIRTTQNLNSAQIGENYSIAQWRNDPNVSQEEKTYFKTIATKMPILDGLDELQDELNGLEVEVDQHSAACYAASYLLDGLLISIPSSEKWQNMELGATKKWIKEDQNIHEEQIHLRHVSDPNHVESYKDWIKSRKESAISSGSDLWLKQDLFSNLEFSPGLKDSLSSLLEGDLKIHQIAKKLSQLNLSVGQWTDGAFNFSSVGFKITPEGEATLQAYGDQRNFECLDGVTRQFSYHFRITPNAWRVYVRPSENSRKIIVGYIGPHLPVASD